jgi:phosphoribosylaminoimidazole-succinocarboxamide synthase
VTTYPLSLPGLADRLVHTGKVRELYRTDDPDRLVMVATDRMSAFDVVLPTPIPDKGRVLTALSVWWFARLADLALHHVLATVPEEFGPPFTAYADALRGRALLVRRLDMVPVECVARAYLAGSGTVQYAATGAVSGVGLPAGLVEGSRLPEPVFTPTTKGGETGHDEPMTYEQVAAEVGERRAAELRELTLAVLARGRQLAEPRGILLADTKIEVGVDGAGVLHLADELLTPDSSRFWPADRWKPGRAQPSYDKQPLRDWLATLDWDRRPPGPPLPDEVVEATRARYLAAYEALTGNRWSAPIP